MAGYNGVVVRGNGVSFEATCARIRTFIIIQSMEQIEIVNVLLISCLFFPVSIFTVESGSKPYHRMLSRLSTIPPYLPKMSTDLCTGLCERRVLRSEQLCLLSGSCEEFAWTLCANVSNWLVAFSILPLSFYFFSARLHQFPSRLYQTNESCFVHKMSFTAFSTFSYLFIVVFLF